MRIATMALMLVLLPACSAVAPYAMIEAGSVIATEKTASDHVISLGSGKDCSSVRVEQGKSYCKEDEPIFEAKPVNCYRTLGDITCYDSPDPYGTKARKVGENSHNLNQPR